MNYLPTARIFSDPTTSWRNVILDCFIEDDEFTHRRRAEEIFLEGLENYDKPVARGLWVYRDYHEILKDYLPLLKNKHVIFETPVSLDMSEERPRRMCVDPFSDSDRAGLQRMELFNADKITHAFPEIVKSINRERKGKELKPLGPYERTKEMRFKPGFYKFSESYYDSKLAKKWYPEKDERELTEHCLYNRDRLVSAFSTIVELIDPEEIVYYGKKTGFAHNIMERVAERTGKRFKDLRAMRNVDSGLGECDPRALNVLKGHISSKDPEIYEKYLKDPGGFCFMRVAPVILPYHVERGEG